MLPGQKNAVSQEYEATRGQAYPNEVTDKNHSGRSEQAAATSPHAGEGWKFLWDSEKDFDQQMIDGWKDELNNLLVFAGLFSAVVTTFTAESYHLLQEDPADKSVELLERISAQLASFTITTGFVNATQALAPPPPFQPDPVDSAINALWFLSLTLSLLAAFFAIAAQQWLRSLSLPHHLSLTNVMRLRQNRHQSLILCQIPQIISFLPVTLQVAVVMFLIGLYLFLRSLQYSIALTFVVVTGIPFLLYGLSLFMPLFWPSCAYKSPLVPAVSAIFRWFILFSVWFAIITIFVPLITLLACSLVLWNLLGGFSRNGRHHWGAIVLRIYHKVTWPVLLLSQRFEETIEDFWVDREVRWLRRQSDQRFNKIDGLTLSRAPQSVPRDQLKRLSTCILSLPLRERCFAVVHWTMFELGDYGEAGYAAWFAFSPIRPELLKKIDQSFAAEYQDLLMLALPTKWSPQCWVDAMEYLPCVLVLLMQIMKAGSLNAESRKAVFRQMVEACKSQDFDALSRQRFEFGNDLRDVLRYPAACLFGSIEDGAYEFSTEDCNELLTLATQHIQQFCALEDHLKDRLLIHGSDIAFGLTASALAALSQQGSPVDAEQLKPLIFALDNYVTAQSQDLHSMAYVCETNPDQPLLVTPRAIVSITKSLIQMRETERIPDAAMESCRELTGHLLALCTQCSAFNDAVAPLQRLGELYADDNRSRVEEAGGGGKSAGSLQLLPEISDLPR